MDLSDKIGMEGRRRHPGGVSAMIHELERLIRTGNLDSARRLLRSIAWKRVRGEDRLAYANLARRAEMVPLALRILSHVRPIPSDGIRRRPNPVSDAEKIEYAACLRSAGVTGEAERLLSEVDPGKYPEATFQLAICRITRWDYQAAVPLLRDSISRFMEGSYSRRVGQINLLEALIHEGRGEEARELIRELREAVDPKQNSLAHLQILELSAQLEILPGGNPEEAVRILGRAEQALGCARQSRYLLQVRKWMAIARSLRDGRVDPDLPRIAKEANRLGQWETARDCEFYQARVSSDRALLIRLWFGTPHESYRRRILDSLGPGARLPAWWDWAGSGSKIHPGSRIFELARGELLDGGGAFGPGQACHRLLILLSQDFYKPVPLLVLFSGLFPRESFHPDFSPNRVHQVLKRLRRWCVEQRVPLAIEGVAGGYRLRFEGAIQIRVPAVRLPLAQKDLELTRLLSLLGREEFEAREAVRASGHSRSKTHRLLQWAVREGRLEFEGWGAAARYRISRSGYGTPLPLPVDTQEKEKPDRHAA